MQSAARSDDQEIEINNDRPEDWRSGALIRSHIIDHQDLSVGDRDGIRADHVRLGCRHHVRGCERAECEADKACLKFGDLSLIHISEPTRLLSISYAVFC